MIYPTQKPEQYSDWVEFFKAERLTLEVCPNSDLRVIYIPSLGMFDTGPSLYNNLQCNYTLELSPVSSQGLSTDNHSC